MAALGQISAQVNQSYQSMAQALELLLGGGDDPGDAALDLHGPLGGGVFEDIDNMISQIPPLVSDLESQG